MKKTPLKRKSPLLSHHRTKPRRTCSKPQEGMGASTLPPGPFRSQTLRDLAADVPHCMRCGKRNEQDIVGCHSNSLELGKGMSQKAHDLLAYGCRGCHDIFDGITPGYTREEREAEWMKAAIKSMVWLLQEGHLQVAA